MRRLTVSFLLALATACSSSGAGEKAADSSPIDGTKEDGGTNEKKGPPAEFIPTPTGECPEFKRGQVTFTVDGKARNARLWISDAAKDFDGPLVFWWHGAGGSPTEATGVLGDALQEILDAGGVVAALSHDPNAGQLPWYLSLGGSKDNDLKYADEIVACAIEKVGIDLSRIHSIGFSAGAMHNTHFVAFRSGYLASIVNYSGARMSDPDEQYPDNKYPAMLFHGGPSDKVIIGFEATTTEYHDTLKATEHFSFMCNHNQGHTVPNDGPAAAWQFLKDHPYGVKPEPYEDALPEGFPSYCEL